MATIRMHDASLYSNVRLLFLISERERDIDLHIKNLHNFTQRQQKMYEISSFHGPP